MDAFGAPSLGDTRDTLRQSRTTHALRTAGRPRRVVYTEPEDAPAVRELCTCHGETWCPDYLDALYASAHDLDDWS